MEIILKLTNACNFACTYCSVGDPEETCMIRMETVKKLIDEMPALLKETADNQVGLIFHGGEPLLAGQKLITEIVEYVRAKLKGYEISFMVQTNGYLINDDWIELFKKYDIKVGISLDGYASLHDANRRTKKGEPTFGKIMENIHLLRERGLREGVLMVLNTETPVDVEQLFSLIRENDLSCKIHSVYPCGRAENRNDIDVVYGAYIDLMKTLYQKSIKESVDISIDPLSALTDSILGFEAMGECSYAGTCGRAFMCLFEDGGMSFCGRSANDFNLGYGNIHNQTLVELYNSDNAKKIRRRQEILRENSCKGCGDFDLCHGGCAFEAVLHSGNLNSKYVHCKQWKELIQFIRTEGLELLKQNLLNKKRECRDRIDNKKALLEELYDRDA